MNHVRRTPMAMIMPIAVTAPSQLPANSIQTEGRENDCAEQAEAVAYLWAVA